MNLIIINGLDFLHITFKTYSGDSKILCYRKVITSLFSYFLFNEMLLMNACVMEHFSIHIETFTFKKQT